MGQESELICKLYSLVLENMKTPFFVLFTNSQSNNLLINQSLKYNIINYVQ